MRRCPVCRGESWERLLEFPLPVPALCNTTYGTAFEAREAPRGDIDLLVCGRCGAIWNGAFRPDLVRYSQRYENSLESSVVFRAYADALATRLATLTGVAGGLVVEAGCGDGAFLGRLCRVAGARGRGFDPGCPAPGPSSDVPGVTLAAREVSVSDVRGADLVCCRHVLEHVEDPVAFAALLGGAGEERRPRAVYVEVPSAGYMLDSGGPWDVIFEHHVYFSEPSLRWALAAGGLAVEAMGTSFGEQYLWAECVPVSDVLGTPGATGELLASAHRFGRTATGEVQRWRDRIARAVGGSRVVAWGIGSKGVTFLNLVDPGGTALLAVDASPRKQGRFVAGTGHRVMAPAELREESDITIVVMNPLYRDEIAAEARAHAPGARLVDLASPG